MVRRRRPFDHGVVALQCHGKLDHTVVISGENAHSGALGVYHFEQGAAQRQLRPCLQLEDLQLGPVVDDGPAVLIIAVRREPHLRGGIGVHQIVLELAVFVRLHACGVEDAVLIDIRPEGETHTAGLSFYLIRRVEHLELPGKAISGVLRGDEGDIPVGEIHDTGALGHLIRKGKGHIDPVITDPGLTPEGKDLLLVRLAVDGHLISGIPVRQAGHSGLGHLIPAGAPDIDVLGRGQDLLRPLELHSGQGGIDLQVVDVPVAQQIAPEGHLGGVVRLFRVLKVQLLQAAGGVAMGHDAHGLGVRADLVGHVLDTLPGRHRLGHALNVRIDAVGRDLLGLPGAVHIVVVGIDQLPVAAIDGEIAHLGTAAVDVDLPQRLLLRGGSGSGRREQAQDRHDTQQQGQKSFPHMEPPVPGRYRRVWPDIWPFCLPHGQRFLFERKKRAASVMPPSQDHSCDQMASMLYSVRR